MGEIGDLAKVAATIQKPALWRLLLGGVVIGIALMFVAPDWARPQLSSKIGDLPARDWVLAVGDVGAGFALWWAGTGAWIWIAAAFGKASAMEAERNDVPDIDATQPQLDPNVYERLDEHERMALAQFIEFGRQSIDASVFGRLDQARGTKMLPAAGRLADRLYVARQDDPYNNYGGARFFLLQKHFQMLSEHPEFVGSNAAPKSFG